MSLLVIAVIAVILACLFVWAADISIRTEPLKTVVKVAIILVAALFIINRAGLV